MVFALILVAAQTLLQGYVFWRAASVPVVRRHVSPSALFGAGAALWGSFVLGALATPGFLGPLSGPLEFWSMAWLGAVFLMTVALLPVELATGFGLLFREAAPRLRGVALALAGVLVVLALYQGLRAPVLRSYEVHSPRLPAALDGTVVVALSDLHLGSMLGPTWLAARIDQVRQLRPDAIVLLGDVFEGHDPPSAELRSLLRQLQAPLGTWGVAGNHEAYSGQPIDGLFEGSGVHLLRDTWVELRPGLVISGVEGRLARPDSGIDAAVLARALAGHPPGATLVLSHAPMSPDVVARSGVDLMLAGHTHGGQLWPFGLLVRRWFPLLAGRYQLGATTVIVLRGTGTWGPRMRLWHPAEIVRVTLRAGESTDATAAASAAHR